MWFHVVSTAVMFQHDFLGSNSFWKCFCDQLYLSPRDLKCLSKVFCQTSCPSLNHFNMNQPSVSITHSVSHCPPPSLSTQITVIQAHKLNIIPPFDIVVLQSHSDASRLITACTLKYTNVCVRSFVNELLFNYNFTWTLLISGANRVSPSVHNYSDCNCPACLWNMLIPQQGHLRQPLWEHPSASKCSLW